MSSMVTNRTYVTSEQIVNTHNELVAQLARADVQTKLQKLFREQAETEAVLSVNDCDQSTINSIQEHIGDLQPQYLRDSLVQQPYNSNLMTATSCLANSITSNNKPQSYNIGGIYLNNRIRLYIHSLMRINQDRTGNNVSVDRNRDIVMSASLENANNMFNITTSLNTDDITSDEIIHELIIGIYGTNRLRRYVPNFSYIYGGFKCSPPLIDNETNKVITWCLHNENSVNYVLSENLSPFVTMEEYVSKCTGSEFLDAYMQIVYASRKAQEICDFTHYNLNHRNVSIRRLDSQTRDFQIAYDTEKGYEYFTTRIVATITNYSMAHIKLSTGQHYGRYGYMSYSVYPYQSSIMHDLYKLLMYCLAEAIQYNNTSVITEATKIFRYFNNTEDPVYSISKQEPLYYSYPYINNSSIDDFASYIRIVCLCAFISDKRSTLPILECESLCLTEKEILEKIGVISDKVTVPDNIIEFYDLATKLVNSSDPIDKEKLQLMTRKFSYRSCMKIHINKMNDMLKQLISLRQNLRLVDASTISLSQLLTYNTMAEIRNLYVTVAYIIDTTMDLKFYNDVGVEVAKYYNDINATNSLSAVMNRFEIDVSPSLDDAKIILERNHAYLNTLDNRDVVAAAITRDPRLRWYWDGRKLYDIVFGRIKLLSQVLPSIVVF